MVKTSTVVAIVAAVAQGLTAGVNYFVAHAGTAVTETLVVTTIVTGVIAGLTYYEGEATATPTATSTVAATTT